MPIIHVHLYEGRTIDQKRKLVSAITDAVVKSIDTKPEAVHIVLHDLAKHNSANAGVLAIDKKG